MAGVEYDVAAFRRAKVVGTTGSLIELRLADGIDPREATQAFREALNEANEVFAEAEAAGKELYGLVTGVTLGPNGPVGVFKGVRTPRGSEAVRRRCRPRWRHEGSPANSPQSLRETENGGGALGPWVP